MNTEDLSSISVSAVVVTHNSDATISKCLDALLNQEHPLVSIILVDSGSEKKDCLQQFANIDRVHIIYADNIGFSRANNLGVEQISPTNDYLVFINPDLFLQSDGIQKAVLHCEEDSTTGMLSGRLLGYDTVKNGPSGRVDSTGIVRKWYGRWIDRAQGERDSGQYLKAEYMTALCGAFLFCRYQALKEYGGNVFDPDFFLYKEDIELSLRLRKRGWRLLYSPDIIAMHCRGWQSSRAEMIPALRLIAAESEVLLYKKHPSIFMIWAYLKYLSVRFARL